MKNDRENLNNDRNEENMNRTPGNGSSSGSAPEKAPM